MAARHLSLHSPALALATNAGQQSRSEQPRSRSATFLAVAAFLPVWLSAPLMLGDFSFAFVVPFAFAAWALTQPAPPDAIYRALRGGGGERGLWIEALCVGGALLLAFLSMFYSSEPERAFRVILPMAYAVCALFILSRFPPLQARRLVYALTFAGVLVMAASLMLLRTTDSVLVVPGYRLRAFFENSNQLGLMLVAMWPVVLALLLNARTAKFRLLTAASLLILASAIFMSGTKTALALSFVTGALLWLYHGSRTGSLDRTLFKISILLCVIVLLVPILMWVLSWASPITFEKVNSILTGGVWNYQSMLTRDEIWNESLRIALANPLLGEGAGVKVLGWAHSHNMFVDYFRGMGIFGLAAAVALVLCVVSRGARFLVSTWRKGQRERAMDTVVAGMYLGAIGYILGNQISDSFSPTTAFLFWMVYFGAYLTSMQTRREPRPRVAISTRGWSPRSQRAAEAPSTGVVRPA